MIDVVEFKSVSEFFSDEKDDIKNNTIRVIDLKDVRFQKLLKWWKNKRYGGIRILHAECFHEGEKRCMIGEDDNMYNFVRLIQNIAVYKELMIITWTPTNEIK